MTRANLGALILVVVCASNQALGAAPRSIATKLDPLFSEYADPTGPAVVAIAVQNGRVIYQHVSGMADIERRVPATMDSMFEVGSTAKMFTAFLVETLIQSGKLSPDDDITRYLPDLTDYGTPILVRDLLYHTSCLRDYFELMAMRGVRLDDSMSQEDALRLVYRQKKLNCRPGSETIYSNTDHLLLAQIVQKVTGQSLADYAEAVLFKPAGMQHAIFQVSRNAIMPDRALSYVKIGPNREIVLPMNYEVFGPTGLWLSGADLAAWLKLLDRRSGNADRIFSAMEIPSKLSEGEPLKWGSGLRLGSRAGLREFYHDGGDQGYRSTVVYFPQRKLEVGIMTNAPNADPQELAEGIADRVLNLEVGAKAATRPKAGVGPIATADAPRHIAATYYSEELDTSYSLKIQEGKLIAEHIRNSAVELEASGPDAWTGESWWFKSLKVVRDPMGREVAFLLSGFRGARDVEFRRIETLETGAQ
jgi:CubicO group peptidase (beta-lactamase class C family)